MRVKNDRIYIQSQKVPQLFFTVSDILSQVVGGVGHCHGLLRLSSSVAALPGIVIFRSRHTSNPGTLGSCNGFEHTYKYFKIRELFGSSIDIIKVFLLLQLILGFKQTKKNANSTRGHSLALLLTISVQLYVKIVVI